MTAENQHYVPDLLLRNFRDSDGRIYRFDKLSGVIDKRPTSKSSAEKGFYEFRIDGKSVSFEREFEKIETAAAPALKKLRDTLNTKSLNQKQNRDIAKLIALQSFRTEAFHRGIGRNLSHEKFGRILVRLWQGREFLFDKVHERQFILLQNNTSQSFYVGDQPVTFQNTESPNSSSSLGFDVPGVEAYFPLTPKLALYLPCKTTTDQIIVGFKNARQMHRNIRNASLTGVPYLFDSLAGLKLSQRALMTSGPVYNALVSGTPLMASAENVENFNYLQVSWASSFVYSNLANFDFAKRLLFESPNFRHFPTVKFAFGFG